MFAEIITNINPHKSQTTILAKPIKPTATKLRFLPLLRLIDLLIISDIILPNTGATNNINQPTPFIIHIAKIVKTNDKSPTIK